MSQENLLSFLCLMVSPISSTDCDEVTNFFLSKTLADFAFKVDPE